MSREYIIYDNEKLYDGDKILTTVIEGYGDNLRETEYIDYVKTSSGKAKIKYLGRTIDENNWEGIVSITKIKRTESLFSFKNLKKLNEIIINISLLLLIIVSFIDINDIVKWIIVTISLSMIMFYIILYTYLQESYKSSKKYIQEIKSFKNHKIPNIRLPLNENEYKWFIELGTDEMIDNLNNSLKSIKIDNDFIYIKNHNIIVEDVKKENYE